MYDHLNEARGFILTQVQSYRIISRWAEIRKVRTWLPQKNWTCAFERGYVTTLIHSPVSENLASPSTGLLPLMASRREWIGKEMSEQHQYNVPLIQCRTECSITPINRKITDAPPDDRQPGQL